MFPIPWNFPFRKKNGNVVNIEDAISGGGGGGSDLPSYDSEDAGKVLSVDDNGELAWSEELKDALEDISDLQEDVQTLDTHVSRIDGDLSLYGGSIISNWEGSGVNVVSNTMKDNTIQGITFTVNEDKTITAVGTSLTAFGSQIGTANLKAGVTYKIFDTINEDVGNANAFIVAMDSNNTILMGSIDTEQYPNEYTPMQDITVKVSFIILPSVTLDKVFYPSIINTSIDPGGYVIPAKSNAQLTAENQTLANEVSSIKDVTDALDNTQVLFLHNSKVVELTSDGTKTYSEMFDDLTTAFDNYLANLPSIYSVQVAYVTCGSFGSLGSIQKPSNFSGIYNGFNSNGTLTQFNVISKISTGWRLSHSEITGTSITHANITNDVPAADLKFGIYVDVYKKISSS